MAMKIGTTYLYTICKYGYPPKAEDDFKALAEIHRMGFKYLEMEGLGKEHTQAVYQKKQQFLKVLNDNNIIVHNFCVVDPDLVSLDRQKRKRAYEHFKIGAELGDFFGTKTFHLASYTAPVKYQRKPFQLGKSYHFEENVRVVIPDGFDFNRVWDTLVESCRFCAEVAKGYKRIVLMEPRVGEIISSSDSLIRLIEDVGMDNFKANFDTAHLHAQREVLPITLEKLKGRYANIHIADNNPVNQEHVVLGKGTIDWEEFFRILVKQKYDGHLGIDLSKSRSLRNDLVESLAFVKKLSRKIGFDIAC